MRVFVLMAVSMGLFGMGCEEAAQRMPPVDANRTAHSNVASPHFTDSDVLIREKGKVVVQEAFSLLSSNLLAAMAAGGPSNAIPFCSLQALPLTETISKHYEVEVRRVSHRVRNPENKPNPRESLVLANFQSQVAAGRTPVPVVVRTNARAFFYAPIIIHTPLCLGCHGAPGTEIDPGTTALLNQLYPNDHATGFKLNELRGMWAVRIQPDAVEP